MTPSQPPTVPSTGVEPLRRNPFRDAAWTCPAVDDAVLAFHRGLPGYAPTPLVDLPSVAAEVGVRRVLAKDESQRLGLPAFKALGASWAVRRAVDTAPAGAGDDGPLTLVTATDGNHGRAVARFSRMLGHRAAVFVPDGVAAAAVAAIREEGAEVTHVAGDYDAAVRAAADRAAAAGALLVQDTAWVGYEEVPQWIVDGYATLLHEVDAALAAEGAPAPGLVVVPTGVGSLLQATLTRYRSAADPAATRVVSVEPVNAACMSASVAQGEPVRVPTGVTSMAGLNCGTVSSLVWPHVRAGLDAAATVTDAQSAAAARDLQSLGVPAGPCGAASLAALRVLAGTAGHGLLPPDATVVLLVTEGTASGSS